MKVIYWLETTAIFNFFQRLITLLFAADRLMFLWSFKPCTESFSEQPD